MALHPAGLAYHVSQHFLHSKTDGMPSRTVHPRSFMLDFLPMIRLTPEVQSRILTCHLSQISNVFSPKLPVCCACRASLPFTDDTLDFCFVIS